MTWRRLGGVGALATVIWLLATDAWGEYRGTDVMGNIGPSGGVGGLADRFPLSHYQLDAHVDTGIGNLDGIPAAMAQFFAQVMWAASSWLMGVVVELLGWAFGLDLLNGPNGALAPVSDAVATFYDRTMGQQWMVVAITVAGIWALWKGLVQRRYMETFGALAMSVAFACIALFFVYQPQQTIGQFSRWTNDLSVAFLGGMTGRTGSTEDTRRHLSDQVFRTMVYQPWVVLEFGGLKHCVDEHDLDGSGFPAPVATDSPRRTTCRDHEREVAGYGGYAPRFLRWAPTSVERTREYKAIRDGKVPQAGDVTIDECPRGDCTLTGNAPSDKAKERASIERQFAGWHVDKADAPAADLMQQGGALQRLAVATIVLLGTIGAVALLGFVALAVVLVQVLCLVLLAFAPVMLVIGMFPGHGHDTFRLWLGKLVLALTVKALYALVLAVVLAVSAALTAATAVVGFLLAFVLNSAFYWAIFVYRKQIVHRLGGAVGGERHQAVRTRHVQDQALRQVMAVSMGALAAPVMFAKRTQGAVQAQRQRSAVKSQAAGQAEKAATNGKMPPDSSSPPASVGREQSGPAKAPGGPAEGRSAPAPGAVATEPQVPAAGRSEKGNVRNFRAMSDEKLAGTAQRLVDSGDQQALERVIPVMKERWPDTNGNPPADVMERVRTPRQERPRA